MKNLRYNGNISSMQWQNGASSPKSGYKFSYDGLNRLTSAIYGEGDDMSQNADRFSEKGITYNANGSIYRMKRYGMLNEFNIITMVIIQLVCHGKRGKN